ncbi:hypothetical protein NBRC111894_1081 [Sporolactobacillus inulinus]|uniref:Uncharacterized protein n=1 Tax=Sporolactobacillus inulinus TaxID=2078 RepID=A0A4Y1Z8Z2_9BACL|nr:hypothetical protein NBRC111894_1081 [Sporolactobacillus inulinus]
MHCIHLKPFMHGNDLSNVSNQCMLFHRFISQTPPHTP